MQNELEKTGLDASNIDMLAIARLCSSDNTKTSGPLLSVFRVNPTMCYRITFEDLVENHGINSKTDQTTSTSAA